MATGLTSTYSIPFPLSTDPVNVHGDVQDLAQQVEDILETKADLLQSNNFLDINSFSSNSSEPTVFILQKGSGNALEVATEENDTTPFIISSDGNVGIKTEDTEGFSLKVVGNTKIDGNLSASNVDVSTSLIFEGSTVDNFQTFVFAEDPTQNNSITLPNETTTLIGDSSTATISNKTLNLAFNTILGTISDFNDALQGNDFATLTGSETFENKNIINSKLDNSIIDNPTFDGEIQNDILFSAGSKILFEGTDDDEDLIALDPGSPTGNKIVTLPNASGTIISTGNLQDAYPPQANNEDRVLTTNGFNVFWGQGGTGGGGSDWLLESSNYEASPNEAIVADTSSSSFTVTLPDDPQLGDKVSIVDYADSFANNPLVLQIPSGSSDTIEGNSSLTINVKGATVVVVYIDATKGWRII